MRGLSLDDWFDLLGRDLILSVVRDDSTLAESTSLTDVNLIKVINPHRGAVIVVVDQGLVEFI